MRGAQVFALALLPGAALADPCGDALAALQGSYGGDHAQIVAAAQAFRDGAACNDATTLRALSQSSGVLAQKAQALVAAGDLDGAEAMLTGAPGLHWALQVVRADIAAARGNRAEAAQLYNDALDTISDPAVTPADPRLVPVAERIARLAQENMMLSGTLDSTVKRSGAASGVLRAAQRGIRIEPVPAPAPPAPQPPAPATPPAYAAAPPAPVVPLPPAPLYPAGQANDYLVADSVAKASKTVFLPIRFAFNSDQLDASGLHEAQTVAAFLKANGITQITLQGHTDEIGSDAFNLDLSLRRAVTVRDFLIHQGVTAVIWVEGKGERVPPKLTDPRLYNDEERRAIARRVELVLQG